MKETSVEVFIDTIDLLFPDPEQAARVAWLKLTDEWRYYLDSGNPSRLVTWDEIKSLILLDRWRATDKHERAYFAFRQTEDETIVEAWRRFLVLARTANVQESRESLWNYFRVRLTHLAKQQFREELKVTDSTVALERIAAMGDVAAMRPPLVSTYAADFVPFTTQKVFAFADKPEWLCKIRCWNCSHFGHKARHCPQRVIREPNKAKYDRDRELHDAVLDSSGEHEHHDSAEEDSPSRSGHESQSDEESDDTSASYSPTNTSRDMDE